MILLTILIIMALTLMGVAIIGISIAGSVGVILFGDIIVCVVLIILLIRWIIKRK
jgi:hypothetical protein